jgi:hypothetical protein
MKTIITLLTLGASVTILNASLVPERIDSRDGVAARNTAAELIAIPGGHEGMIVSRAVDRSETFAMPESIRTFAERPLERYPSVEPVSTVPELIALSDLRHKMTVSQEAEAASITVPEPATIFAGVPLLLPFLAGMLRILKQNRMVKQIA